MRPIERIEPFLKEVGDIWKERFPDWRFGQLIYNFISENGDPFCWEDEEFLARLNAYLQPEKEEEEEAENNKKDLK